MKRSSVDVRVQGPDQVIPAFDGSNIRRFDPCTLKYFVVDDLWAQT